MARPESLAVLAAMADRSSGRPEVGVYLWVLGSRHASAAASTMWAGVGKSGSPAPKPITGSPAAFRALAFASTANVADSAMAAMRWETRFMSAIVASHERARNHHSGRPSPERRPVRVGALEGPPRSDGGPGQDRAGVHGHQPPAGDGPVHGGGAAQRPGRVAGPARRLRGHARQRRHDG